MLILLTGGWWLVSSLRWVPAYVLPPPQDVMHVVVLQRRALAAAAFSTLGSALAGFFAAVVFGLASGFLMYRSAWLYKLSMPAMVVIKSTPVVAVVPLFALAFGVGAGTKLVLTFFICFFPMVLSAHHGLRTVPKGLTDFSCAVRASRSRHALWVELPSAGSELLLGMQLTLPLAFVGAVVAEMAGGDEKGLGHLVITASYHLDTGMLYASLLLLAVISAGSFYLLGQVAKACQQSLWEAW